MSALSKYENRKVKITTEDGSVFTGRAGVFPSGYGLHEFGREEESVLIGDTQIFRSEIRKIETFPDDEGRNSGSGDLSALMGDLLEGPYFVADILPEQVPENSDGRYFAVERYFLRPERLRLLRRGFAEILLKLNCYYDMKVSFDNCESWDNDPDPEQFAERLEGLSGNFFLRAVFESRRVMIDIEPDDTYMTVYDPDLSMMDLIRPLSAAAGLFVWSPEQDR